MMEYTVEDHIEEVPTTSKAYGRYKYRVMDRNKEYPTHHTSSMKDAHKWLERCREYWIANPLPKDSTND